MNWFRLLKVLLIENCLLFREFLNCEIFHLKQNCYFSSEMLHPTQTIGKAALYFCLKLLFVLADRTSSLNIYMHIYIYALHIIQLENT